MIPLSNLQNTYPCSARLRFVCVCLTSGAHAMPYLLAQLAGYGSTRPVGMYDISRSRSHVIASSLARYFIQSTELVVKTAILKLAGLAIRPARDWRSNGDDYVVNQPRHLFAASAGVGTDWHWLAGCRARAPQATHARILGRLR